MTESNKQSIISQIKKRENLFMPKPYEFKSEEELISLLSSKETLLAANKYFNDGKFSIADIVKRGVASNTYRAFKNLPVKPSVVFREWAKENIELSIDFLGEVKNSSDYSKFIHKSTQSLCDKWSEKTKSEMGYGRGAKLFNLILKQFVCYKNFNDKQKKSLIPLLHVPLDSFTIVGLRSVAKGFSIPRNASMNYIKTPAQYKGFQNLISEIAKKANVPAIYYDILAWDLGHK